MPKQKVLDSTFHDRRPVTAETAAERQVSASSKLHRARHSLPSQQLPIADNQPINHLISIKLALSLLNPLARHPTRFSNLTQLIYSQ
jgi:hypothetical protein